MVSETKRQKSEAKPNKFKKLAPAPFEAKTLELGCERIRTLKALSVKQPWANMIASGEKRIETRTWKTRHRGNLLIVSSKSPRIEPAGYAVARVTLVDCRPMTADDEEAACCSLYPKAIAWVLEAIRRIQPFPVKGTMGIYEVEVDEAMLKWVP